MTISDNQRRVVCRLLFLIGCMLPTTLSIYMIVHRPGPDEWERWIQANLGVRVDIESVETPLHGRTILRGVRLVESVFDVTTEARKLQFDEIHLVQSEGLSEIVFVQPITVDSDSLATTLSRFQDQLQQIDLGNTLGE